ncbi:MAG: hypothetical protein EOP45_21475 [Sphingobacteriaceae bacterium]|nr:MAG: hypothetical protein EOP45_21475 [Sphingobacteriaceae bacterium]
MVIYTDRTINREELFEFLQGFKKTTGAYMAVASFNAIYGPEIIDTHFPGLFDCVICDSPVDCEDWSKLKMLQKIRKQFSKDMKALHNRSTKLKWREMLMFDDNENVIKELNEQRPELKCITIHDKTGLTSSNRALIEVMDKASCDFI